MSFAELVIEGAQRAAQALAVLLTLHAAAPAAAQPAAPVQIEALLDGSPLALAAHHFDVRVSGDRARVRSLLVMRNHGETTVAAQYRLAQPAVLRCGDFWNLLDSARPDSCAQKSVDADLSPADAQCSEAGRPNHTSAGDVITVAPGEAVTLEFAHEIGLSERDGVHRLVLPLPVDRDAPWLPRFSADVLVQAAQPIRRLASPTHAAIVDGIGDRMALLAVPEGYVYRQQQLAVEFELAPLPAQAAR